MPAYIKLLSIILISCLGVLAYSNTFHCAFQLDDAPSITDNFAIKNIHHLQDVWNFWPTRFVSYLSFALNYHFNGLNVTGYHLFNLAVHLAAAILVWWLVLLTFSTPVMQKEKITPHANVIALFAGLVFVAHPLQTQAVTYIVQREASMAAMFYLASLSLYVKSRLLQDGGEQRIYYIGALLTAVLAMFTKENTITLPLMVLLYEFSFLKTTRGTDWKRLALFLSTLFIIPLTILCAEIGPAKLQQIHTPPGISSLHYFLTQLRVIVTYIRLEAFPFHQNLDYDYPVFNHFLAPPVLFSFLFLIAALSWAKHLFSKHRLVSFSIFWFFLTLLPESSFFPIKDIIFEHRLYLPMVGYSIFLVSGMYYGAALFCRSSQEAFSLASFRVTMAVLTVIIAYYSVLTYQRNMIWKDGFTLWNDAVQGSPHKARPYNNRGSSLATQGKLAQAMADYNKAIQINPTYTGAYNNRGFTYYKQGHLAQAMIDYNKAIEINPRYEMAYVNRGVVYEEQGDFDRAISNFNKAIELRPDYTQAYADRGVALAKQSKFIQAMSDFNKAIELNPDYSEAYGNRGIIFYKQGNFIQAMSDYNKAIELNPNYAEALNNRAIVIYLLKEYDKAWEYKHKARKT